MTPTEELKQVFPSFEAELVESLETHGVRRQFDCDEVLMRSGQYIRSTLLVLNGLVKVYREDDEGNEFFMYHIAPGQACAVSMTCVVAGETSKITAKTMVPTTAILVPVAQMDDWMATYRSWYHFVVQTYRSRFDELLQTLDSVAFRNLDDRIAFFLKRQAQALKTKIIPITHHEIAQELNSSREVVSRLLKKMAERGSIQLGRNHIEILES